MWKEKNPINIKIYIFSVVCIILSEFNFFERKNYINNFLRTSALNPEKFMYYP